LKLSSKADEWIQVGAVVGAHGVKGGLKISYFAESMAFMAPGRQVLIESDQGRRAFRIVQSQPYKKYVRLVLEQVATREQAEALTGCGVFIAREDLPALEADSHYWVDLIGLSVHSTSGQPLGRVTGIIATGANDVYVVRPPDGGPDQEILVPAIASVVIEIDAARGRMIVDLPEGLVEER
jgi:16S rRNA processing protein RimM